MSRAPYQILIIPFKREVGTILYAVFQRSDNLAYQFIAGGGEDTESPHHAAARELYEETSIKPNSPLIALRAQTQIPASVFTNDNHLWPSHIQTIPEHCFAIDITSTPNITLSAEHTSYHWLTYEQAILKLTYQSNQIALTELQTYLQGK